MTLADLLVDLKNIIGPGVTVDDSGLTKWINDAYLYMVDAVQKDQPDRFIKASVANSVSGQQEYLLPTDFEKMLMVNIQYSGSWRRALPITIDKIPVLQASSSTNEGFTPGTPYYYIVGNSSGTRNIGFMPIPTDTAVGSLKIWYIYTPSELSASSDTPIFVPKYHHLIKFGAYANYLDQDDQHPAAQAMRNTFEQRVQAMVEALNEQQVEEPKSISITSNYDLYVDQEYI